MKTFAALRGVAFALLAALLIAGCASVDSARTMTFSEAEIGRLLQERAPMTRRLLEVLDVRVENPRVRLLPFSNRLSTDLDVATTERTSGKTYKGRMSVDYGLRYDDLAKAIRMTEVRVNELEIAGLPSPRQSGLSRLGTLIAEQLLEDAVVYRFKPGELMSAEGRGVKPGDISVTSRGVQITLPSVER